LLSFSCHQENVTNMQPLENGLRKGDKCKEDVVETDDSLLLQQLDQRCGEVELENVTLKERLQQREQEIELLRNKFHQLTTSEMPPPKDQYNQQQQRCSKRSSSPSVNRY
jgi:predicted nuclease with TOPRIM domain